MNRYIFERTVGLGALLAAAIVILCMQGCATFGSNMTIDQKAALVRATTVTATSVGLSQIKDVNDRHEIAATVASIADKIIQVVDNRGPKLTGRDAVDLLSNLIPPQGINDISPEVRAALSSIVDVALSQVELPSPADLVSTDTLVLLRAALDGIRYGAQLHVLSPVRILDPSTGEITVVYPAGVRYTTIDAALKEI